MSIEQQNNDIDLSEFITESKATKFKEKWIVAYGITIYKVDDAKSEFDAKEKAYGVLMEREMDQWE